MLNENDIGIQQEERKWNKGVDLFWPVVNKIESYK